MNIVAFVFIVISAVLHASWNLLAKKSRMSLAFYTVICSTAMLCWLHTQLWSPLPLWKMPGRVLLCIACSVASDVIYCLGLIRAYRKLEMSTAYPMMRSLPLVFTALITSFCGLGRPLSGVAIAGMFVVFCGCLLMPMAKLSDFRLSNYFNRNILFILIVAGGTTGYTIFDSLGQRCLLNIFTELSKPLASISYYSSRGIILTSTLWLCTLLSAEDREIVRRFWTDRDKSPVLAGIFASLSYVLVLLAMNYVTNVSFVQAFRQMGLVFAMLAGIFILKERSTLPKILGCLLIVAGLILSVS
ncbi:MAG: EamA family transporter [Lentisphaeria bacterium]|nr:EamA family transporter [Lentisphaeria bacterium]